VESTKGGDDNHSSRQASAGLLESLWIYHQVWEKKRKPRAFFRAVIRDCQKQQGETKEAIIHSFIQ